MPKLRVREIAEQQGLNASKLSRRADLSQPVVYGIWNNPYAVCTTVTLEKLAKALGVSIGELFEVSDEGKN
jgi:DNA-binding Xre family transcriptional regulator